jgi:hypothetical protein
LACHGAGKRNMRPADVQIYELPPADASWTLNPPEYQKEEGLKDQAQDKDRRQNPNGLGGAGSGMGAQGGMNNTGRTR